MPHTTLLRYATARAPVPAASHCWSVLLQETLRHSKAGLVSLLWGHYSFPWVLVHKRLVCALWASLVGMRFESKYDLIPPTVLLGLLLCLWIWGIFFWWDPTFSCQLLFSSCLWFWCSCKRWEWVLLHCHHSFESHERMINFFITVVILSIMKL